MTDRVWPKPLGPAAYHGLVGRIVEAMEPHTEADPGAILTQFLVCFGNVIGRCAYWQVESTPHFSNLYLVVVGESSKGRKGTSFDNTMSLFKTVDESWADQRVSSGLSTGEGLIWAVRDPVIEQVPKREKGKPVRYESTQTDPGESDKRLLVVEPEFARVLSVGERDGNTLSPVLRNAWDSKPLNILTKRQAGRCSKPHISIIAHITRDELLRLLSDTAIANGFANRFLFACAQRSKCLPFGGNWGRIDWAPMIKDLDAAVNRAPHVSLISLSSQAEREWESVYPALSAGQPGMVGAITTRAEAQVLRLAMLYALLDHDDEIDLPHLHAALEVWRYCDESCRYIFGDNLGDPTADEILRALRQHPEGLTRKDISDLFNRHKKAADIERALDVLKKAGRAKVSVEETGGRPTERWVMKE